MSGEVVRRGGAVTRKIGTDLAFGGTAQSTARIAFDGEVITWRQLSGATRRAVRRRSPVVAEAVQRDHRRTNEGGRAFEHATAWRVHEDAVVLAAVARPVAPASKGPWEHRTARVRLAAGPPRRRRGVVDVADELTASERGSLGLLGMVATGHGPAAEAWSHLPQAVRTAAERLVPNPVVWLGELVQHSTPDRFPLSQDVRCLRMSDDRVVVVVATRSLSPIRGADLAYHDAQMARVPWVVEQVGLDLASGSETATIES